MCNTVCGTLSEKNYAQSMNTSLFHSQLQTNVFQKSFLPDSVITKTFNAPGTFLLQLSVFQAIAKRPWCTSAIEEARWAGK